jgi:hypothetical protein
MTPQKPEPDPKLPEPDPDPAEDEPSPVREPEPSGPDVVDPLEPDPAPSM